MEIDREIISMVVLPFPLLQEGQMSFTGKSTCTGCSISDVPVSCLNYLFHIIRYYDHLWASLLKGVEKYNNYTCHKCVDDY